MKTLRIPLQLDSRRRLAVASSTPDVVRSQILDILVTARGERQFRPSYGGGVPEMLFGNIDPAVFGAKENDIKAVLTSLVRGGTIVSVQLSETDNREDGTLIVTVLFSLIPGGELFTAQQTFTGLVTEETFIND
jgi:phage baseplate assembly protein W